MLNGIYSIYYKFVDDRRATLNWIVALQLDPELTEIYDFSAFTREKLIIDKEGLLDIYEKTKDDNYYINQNNPTI